MAQTQDAVYELMRERLVSLFGPGGSFRVTLARGTADDAVFVATIADTVAWAVAAELTPQPEHVGRRVDAADPDEAEYRRIWKHVEAQLLARRAEADPLAAPVRTGAHSAA